MSEGPHGTRAERRKGGAGGMEQARRSTRLMALSGAAIVAVYAAGYARTEAAARQLATPVAAAASAQSSGAMTSGVTSNAADGTASSSASPATASVPSSTTTVTPAYADDGYGERHRRDGVDAGGTAAPSAPAPVSTAPAPPAPATSGATQGKYKNGTYTAVGYGRHGPVQVQVVVQGGKVVSANITQCGTRYPCSVIADLPGEVVAQQSAQIDFVSGATDSSTAYQQAVAQALGEAQ